ncbi:nucleoside phosphorylase [Maribellus maritimus]|uniref:nucleoside phosphorylase n=1 Tax=Maribellus maritimus TaxID=2870838 RepID=UPI001EEC338C|nr:nucleoside phosphorylase [Maribellus maritimus]MCG6188119.1 nucleoside phosphorylase [Maribellus maritimus]
MIGQSELILNNDGTIFHLHLKPENISEQIILVGDPARVDTISSLFENIEFETQNREFKTVTGIFNKKRLTLISTGIGTDNIDIVLNELDALVNIDLKKREIKDKKTSLNIVRIGTSGGLQTDLPVNSFVISQKAIGFDGMLNFYANRKNVCDLSFETAFKQYTKWDNSLPTPYVVDASENLLEKFEGPEFRKGVTISAPGFYGPQGRELRLPLAVPELNRKIEEFSFNDLKITNFEMECSAIYGLSKMLGHKALTICLIIANRVSLTANENYREEMKKLIKKVLNALTN